MQRDCRQWSLGELEFTQRLELANTGSNEHGMVMINYDVQNHGSEDVKVEARMLLDSAVGDQDFVYYEIPNTSYDSDIIKRECVLDAANIPTAFYAYDDIYSPTATASTVVSSKGMLKKSLLHTGTLWRRPALILPRMRLWILQAMAMISTGQQIVPWQCTMILEQSSREKKEL